MASIEYFFIFEVVKGDDTTVKEVLSYKIPEKVFEATRDDPLNEKLDQIEAKGIKKLRKKFPNAKSICVEDFDEGTKEDGEALVKESLEKLKPGLVLDLISATKII